MQKDPRMHFRLPHLMDHGIYSRMRELIDEHSIVMMRIFIHRCIHLVTEEQRLVIEIYL